MLKTTRTTFRVRYPEVDRMSFAHHAAYLVWFELGRTEMLRESGLAYSQLEELQGLLFPLTEAGARYKLPARYDEQLVVETVLTAATRLRVDFEYRILRPEDGVVIAEGYTKHVAADDSGRPRRMPKDVLAKLTAGTGVQQ